MTMSVSLILFNQVSGQVKRCQQSDSCCSRMAADMLEPRLLDDGDRPKVVYKFSERAAHEISNINC